AAILLVKIPHLGAWSDARRRNASIYDREFAGSAIGTPWINPDATSIYNQYVIRVSERNELMAHLHAQQIGCEIYYPVPMHMQECFRNLGYKEGDLPVSECAAREVLALPVYPELSTEQIQFVSRTILDRASKLSS